MVATIEPPALIGSSQPLARILEAIERVARAPRTTVLITGESGTGKELVAREIHARSSRADRPFLAVNCASLGPDLLESELFGYAPGAFTGALPKGREGLFSAVEGGTLFLDEIGELEIGLQAKLLRVLQERAYRPVGAHQDLAMDVRIIAATNRKLPERVAEGAFREDLYYRLNVLSIHVPALRERREDVKPLAQHFLRDMCAQIGGLEHGFAPCALAALEAHAWPGNVRELKNTIERSVLEAGARAIESKDLGLPQSPSRPSHDAAQASGNLVLSVADRSLKSVERALIEQVLDESRGNMTRAARVLGIHRATLYHKLEAYGLATR